MTLRQLEYWLAVVDAGSFTEAARRKLVAQPSLSQQIRALEAEVGAELLERLPRGFRLTAAGKALLPHARAAVVSAERAAHAARSVAQLEIGELEIATVRSLAVGLLPASIERWHARHRAPIRLHEYAHRHALQDSVRNGVGDLGIGPRPVEWAGPLAPLGWQGFVVVLPPNDPLAEADAPVPLEALADHHWVLFEPGHGLSDLVAAACACAGFQPRAAVHTSQVEAAARLAAAGLGPALVPDNAVPSGLASTVRPPVRPVGHELAAFTRGQWSPAAGAYLEILREGDWTPRPPDAVVVN